MQSQKKQWVRPQVVPVDLARARDLILEALKLIDGDIELEAECADLRSILDGINAELHENRPPS